MSSDPFFTEDENRVAEELWSVGVQVMIEHGTLRADTKFDSLNSQQKLSWRRVARHVLQNHGVKQGGKL